MPDPRPEVLDFLMTRRSRPAKTLGGEGPGREELMTLLTAAARAPDHGKLVPWRFLVIEGEMRIEFRDGAVQMRAGDLFVVPKGIEHRPVAEREFRGS